MAEGGMEFHNPEYDKEDYDKDDSDNLPMVPNESVSDILNTSEHLQELRGQIRDSSIEQQKERLVKLFYDTVAERYKIRPNQLDYKQFKISEDGKILYWVIGDKEINMMSKRGGVSFKPLNSLATEFTKMSGEKRGGTAAIRTYFNLTDYSTTKSTVQPQEIAAIQSTSNELSNVNIPMQDISSPQEVQDLTDTVDEVETAVKTLETSFLDNWQVEERSDNQTQTDMTKREMDGILKAMTSVKEELANELAKLTETNKELADENDKLTKTKDEDTKKQIESRIKDLESERSARLEVININKEKLRSQVNRIKETINKILKEDTTLGQRLRTLFREQGITIVSILTAVGMIIGFIVEAVLPSGGATTPPPPSKPDGGSAKDWVKKQLTYLGKLLANLAGKAATALPGVIGSIVSWLLSTTGKVVNWFGEHLWALVVLVVGLLYAAAKEYIS
jgi:hypothetical protein